MIIMTTKHIPITSQKLLKAIISPFEKSVDDSSSLTHSLQKLVYYLFGTTEQEELWYVTVMWQYWNIL